VERAELVDPMAAMLAAKPGPLGAAELPTAATQRRVMVQPTDRPMRRAMVRLAMVQLAPRAWRARLAHRVQLARQGPVARGEPRVPEERQARLDPVEPAAQVVLAARLAVLAAVERRAVPLAQLVRPAPEVRARQQVLAAPPAEPQEPAVKVGPAGQAEAALEAAVRARAMTVVVPAVSARARRIRGTDPRAV
jgi:hypothetical protein